MVLFLLKGEIEKMAVDIIARAMAAKANSGGGNQPDLSNYVQFDDYPTSTTAGVVKNYINGFQVSGTGNPNTTVYSAEQYDTIGDYYFIGKGTLENAKDKIVGSSTPVQDLTATVTNVQNDQDESMPKQTASGEIVSVDDAIAYKTFNVTVDGASEQVTTTGKNLLENTSHTQTINGVTFTENADGSVTANGTATGDVARYIVNSFNFESDVDYFLSGCPKNGTNSTYRMDAFSEQEGGGLSEDFGEGVKINISGNTSRNIRIIVFKDATVNNLTFYPMIIKGSTATSYEPYTGGQPSPNPDYPQEITTLTFDKITRCGKNLYELIDYDGTVIGMNLKIENQILSLDGTSNSTWFSIGNISNQNNIPRLKKDEDYTVTFISTFNKDLNCTLWNDVGNVIIQGVQCNPVKANSKSSFTFKCSYDEILTNFRIAFAGFTVGEAVQGTMQIMIEPGTQATDYEPYQATEYTIDLQGNEMVEIPNGVKDELVIDKQGNVNLIKNVGKYFFDGSEDWSSIPDTDTYWEFMYIFPTGNQANYTYSLSNYFSNEDYNRLICTGLEVYIRFPKNIGIDVSDAEKFKSWLQSHNTIAYYQLANPQPISLGKLSDIITTLNGTNNISINGNIPTTISTTYALDIKKYIDNKLAEISTQIIKEG